MNSLSGYVFAPKSLVDEKKPILYMYREIPDSAYDTGWRFFAGDETDEYVNNPTNIGIYDINTISVRYPYVRRFLHYPPGSVFVRDNVHSEFTIEK